MVFADASWGVRQQQLGVYFRKLVAPLIFVHGVGPSLSYRHRLFDATWSKWPPSGVVPPPIDGVALDGVIGLHE